MNKKLIPLDILIPVEKALAGNSDIIENKREENCFYSIHDRDESAGYHYKIIADPKKVVSSSASNYNSDMVYCKCFPASSKDIRENTFFLKREDLLANLSTWIEAIKTFNETQSVYDDSFLKTYQDYYHSEFKSVDEDADFAPFDPAQQEVIERYLLHIGQKLLDYREISDKPEPIDEIIADIKESVDEMPASTKSKVTSRISRIMAKVFRWQKGIANDFYNKAKEEVINTVIREGAKRIPGAIDIINDNLDKIS